MTSGPPPRRRARLSVVVAGVLAGCGAVDAPRSVLAQSTPPPIYTAPVAPPPYSTPPAGSTGTVPPTYPPAPSSWQEPPPKERFHSPAAVVVGTVSLGLAVAALLGVGYIFASRAARSDRFEGGEVVLGATAGGLTFVGLPLLLFGAQSPEPD